MQGPSGSPAGASPSTADRGFSRVLVSTTGFRAGGAFCRWQLSLESAEAVESPASGWAGSASPASAWLKPANGSVGAQAECARVRMLARSNLRGTDASAQRNAVADPPLQPARLAACPRSPEAVDVELGDPVAEAVQDELAGDRVVAVERIPASRVVVRLPLKGQQVPGGKWG